MEHGRRRRGFPFSAAIAVLLASAEARLGREPEPSPPGRRNALTFEAPEATPEPPLEHWSYDDDPYFRDDDDDDDGSDPFADCFVDPSVCSVKPFKACVPCDDDHERGCCFEPPVQPDCYLYPDTCDDNSWCQLNDRKSWNEDDTTTMGRCVSYQSLGESCSGTFEEDNPPIIPGLNAFAFYANGDLQDALPKPIGSYLTRETRCDPNKGLVCTGNLIPSLPGTCVHRRELPEATQTAANWLTADMLYDWGKRMIRMGARNLLNSVPNRTAFDQDPQGNPREEIHAGVNFILRTLWNSSLWGVYEDIDVESTYDELCCTSDEYAATLTEFQSNRTGASWRNPLNPDDEVKGNAPPCVWCQYDGAYNDENPSIWSLIHALTFNLPNTVTEPQFQVLQSLPLWLRQHLSCALCRSHIKEHLIDLGIPNSRSGIEWGRYFWQAHNFINEQSEVTRCGSQSCGWGIWQTPPAYRCAGVYRNPWFMSFEDATMHWMLPPKDTLSPKEGQRDVLLE